MLGEKWAPHIKGVDVCSQPLDMIMARAAGPRQEVKSSAIFTISTTGQRKLNTIFEVDAPMLELAWSPSYIMDLEAEHILELQKLIIWLAPLGIQTGRAQRSPAHSKERPRARM